MTKQRFAVKLIRVLTLCVVSLSVVTIVPAAHHLQAQDTERVIKRTEVRNAPVELVDVKLGGQSLKDQEKVTISRNMAVWKELKFQANDDWLKGLQFRFKKVSGKPIVAMSVSFLIKLPHSENRWSLPLAPSRRLPMHLRRGMPETETLASGEEVAYAINLSELGRIEGMVKSVGATTTGVSAVELDMGSIQSDYDNAWNDGELYRRDPGNADR